MKIIKDEQRLINLHPLVIYFMLPAEQYAKYGERLKRQNWHKDFTRGIFKFQAFSLEEEHSDYVPAALTESLRDHNMMVRLVDDADGNFYYALHNVDFNAKTTSSFPFDDDADYELMESSMQSFIIEVCKQNVAHLDEWLGSKSAAGSSLSRQNYTQMRDAFQNIVLHPDFRHGVWREMNSTGERVLYCLPFEDWTDKVKAIDKLKEVGFSADQAKLAVDTLLKTMEEEFKVPEPETSDGIAQDMVGKKSPGYIHRDQTTRIEPETKPILAVAIKRICVGVTKSGRERRHWGVEFHVNDVAFPVYFGSKPETMIYICALLRAKLGEKMYRHEFIKGAFEKKNGRFKKAQTMKWLEQVYYTIYPSMDPSFDIWMDKIYNKEKDMGRPLSQGKSSAARKVQDALEEQPDGRYYCVVDTNRDGNDETYYRLRLEPDEITIPEEMQYLVDEFYSMTGIKPLKKDSQNLKE